MMVERDLIECLREQRHLEARRSGIEETVCERQSASYREQLLYDTIASLAEYANIVDDLRQQLAASQAREAEAYERAAKATCSGCASEVPINEDGYHQHGSFTFPCHATAIRALAGREG